jgi:hypothetical protein
MAQGDSETRPAVIYSWRPVSEPPAEETNPATPQGFGGSVSRLFYETDFCFCSFGFSVLQNFLSTKVDQD